MVADKPPSPPLRKHSGHNPLVRDEDRLALQITPFFFEDVSNLSSSEGKASFIDDGEFDVRSLSSCESETTGVSDSVSSNFSMEAQRPLDLLQQRPEDPVPFA